MSRHTNYPHWPSTSVSEKASTGERFIRLQRPAFTGDTPQHRNEFLVTNSGEVLAYDDVAGHYTTHHSLTDADKAEIVAAVR